MTARYPFSGSYDALQVLYNGAEPSYFSDSTNFILLNENFVNTIARNTSQRQTASCNSTENHENRQITSTTISLLVEKFLPRLLELLRQKKVKDKF